MASIFTKIVNGEIPCYKVAETNDFLAFLDIRPLTKGHTLVIPKKEVDNIFDLDQTEFAGLHLFSQLVAKAIQRKINCVRVGVVVMGLEVPHAHIH
ncbi:MAG: HIT family protein, partial [Bacteroidia bacterium]|nr:HIT family protein [Bacteroidia bacterium]